MNARDAQVLTPADRLTVTWNWRFTGKYRNGPWGTFGMGPLLA